jgi:hypothetical protein
VAKIVHHVDQQQLAVLLRSPSGAVAKDLFRRGKNVEKQAKINLERTPRRIDTGTLRSSIHTTLVVVGGQTIVQVGTTLFYARYVHDGTGIYGPRGTVIRPTTAKALRWRVKGGTYRFAKYVKGMRPNRFLRDAVVAAKG